LDGAARACNAPGTPLPTVPSILRRAAVLVVFALLTFSATRRADATPAARLVYVRSPGTESCPDEVAVRAAVAARLGYNPFFRAAPATMTVEVSKNGDGYRGHIQLIDENGNVRGVRDIAESSPRCEDIIDTLALTMSLAIDPLSLSRPPPPVTSADDTRAPPVPPPPSDNLDVQRPIARHEALHLEAGAGASVWSGAAPAPNFGGSLFVRTRARSWSLALEGRADLPASRVVAEGAVKTNLAFGSLVPCFHLRYFSGCVVGSFGVLHATSDVHSPNDAFAFHAAVGPRLGAELPVHGSVALWAHVDALWTLTPEILQIGGVDAYPLPRVSVGVTIGGSVRFF
jgi:hypothetical protein